MTNTYVLHFSCQNISTHMLVTLYYNHYTTAEPGALFGVSADSPVHENTPWSVARHLWRRLEQSVTPEKKIKFIQKNQHPTFNINVICSIQKQSCDKWMIIQNFPTILWKTTCLLSKPVISDKHSASHGTSANRGTLQRSTEKYSAITRNFL